MSAPMPVPIWPWPVGPERLDVLRQAKAALDLPYKILPVEAVPGSPGRILCFGEIAPFYAEHVLIGAANVDKPESVSAALRFLLEAPAGAEGSISEQSWLEAVLGCGVNLVAELSAQDLEDERVEREIAEVQRGGAWR